MQMFWTLTTFPFNFILLFVVSLFLIISFLLIKYNIKTTRQITKYISIALFFLCLIHIERQISFIKEDINNNAQAIKCLQEDVLYNKPMYDENGNLLNPEYFHVAKENTTINKSKIIYREQPKDKWEEISRDIELDKIKKKQFQLELDNSSNYWNNRSQIDSLNKLQKENEQINEKLKDIEIKDRIKMYEHSTSLNY